ncbi:MULTISPECIES: hypothetical protein [Mycolicibacterium]|jgi:hypothetical protein|uniref:Restriction endonuclease n=1 Tax=Mycolicibacterium mucogenicum TaxID=56689 RepID=A0A1A0MYF7_MYCMU|nr:MULTISPECIES: hypothetical protein [Mycolicibacterium]OBA89828.1 hypothetical protein A5642_14255 [Mycolicibacterium mucogenicum]BCI81688.1 hypothetical protein MTY66_33130 [Mycolicibacterium sp. TY66]BCJ80663.1 hypothetical protein MTY81_20360 [Mycolicibacterium sp. TY81]GCA97869.1 hypothetical protein NCCNTM_15040 [Mycolicibacterium sp. NCC-Tsukiji]
MTHLDKQEFYAWAYHDLLANTTRGVLAEYIVARALGIDTKKITRVEWDKHDLEVDGIGVEVKSAAYVQSWHQDQDLSSMISFNIGPAKWWDARTNTYAANAERSADVYVFCLLNGTKRDDINPLDVTQWAFHVLATSILNQKAVTQKTIRLGPLIALGAQQCAWDTLGDVIREKALANREHSLPERRPARPGFDTYTATTTAAGTAAICDAEPADGTVTPGHSNPRKSSANDGAAGP